MNQVPQPSAPELVGRASELRELQNALNAADAGHGAFVLVDGVAGIGKTALSDAISLQARRLGFGVATGHAYDISESTPYSIWLDLFRDLGLEQNGDEAAMGMFNHPAGATPSSQFAYLDRLAVAIIRATDQKSLLIVLEDLHWADIASLELLRVVGQRMAGSRLMILCTYRSDDVSRRDALFHHLPALVREARAFRISLQPLDRNDIVAFLRSRHAIDVNEETEFVEYLFEHSDGNPLFLDELVRTLLQDKMIDRQYGELKITDLTRVIVPPLIQQLLLARVETLDASTQTILQVASAVGQVVPFDALAAVCEMEALDLAAGLREAVDSHVLRQSRTGQQLEFTHALLRDVIYDNLIIPERRSLHRQVAEFWLTSQHHDPDVIAAHLQRAGDPRTVEWLIRAGNQSQRKYALRTAAARFEAALNIVGAPQHPSRDHGWLLYRTGRLLRFSNPVRAAEYLERAGAVGDQIGDAILEAYAIADRGLMQCFTGALSEGIANIEAGNERLAKLAHQGVTLDTDVISWVHDRAAPPDDSRVARPDELFERHILKRWGTQVYWLATVGHLQQALEIGAQHLDDHPWPAGIVAGLAAAHAALGQPERAHEYFERARQLTDSVSNYALTGQNTMMQLIDVDLRYYTDDLPRRRKAQSIAETAWSRAADALPSAVPANCALARPLFLEGQWQEARRLAHIEVARGFFENRPRAEIVLISIGIAQGRNEAAWRRIHQLLPDGPATQPGEQRLLVALDTQRLAAELSLAEGDLTKAHAWLDAHDSWAAWAGANAGLADSSALRARLFRIDGKADAAEECAQRALNEAGNPRQPLALHAAHREIGMVLLRRGAIDEARKHLQAALELATACGAEYLNALRLVDLAELELAANDTRQAAQCLSVALGRLRDLGAQPALRRAAHLDDRIPARSRAAPIETQPAAPTAIPAGLTEREREVLQFLASGMTNREIASALELSVRTIERHVSNIYVKIDAHNRVDATAFAIRHELA